MPARRRQVAAPRFLPIHTGDVQLDRVQQNLASTLNAILESPFGPGNFRFMRVTLVDGRNRIAHGLGKAPAAVFVDTDTLGALTKLWNAQATNPDPDKELWIDTVFGGSNTAEATLLILCGAVEGRRAPALGGGRI